MHEEQEEPRPEIDTNQIVEALRAASAESMASLKAALEPVKGGPAEWNKVLKTYSELIKARGIIERILFHIVNSPDGQEVLELLFLIRQEERRNLELRVAMANKTSPQDVTTEFTVSNEALLNDEDPGLKRIALANAKKAGRKLTQKWHPDKEDGNAEVFQLCDKAIKEGDVELVHILLYRYGDSNYEAPPEFHPVRLQAKLEVRLVKYQGSRIFMLFAKWFSQPREEFIARLENHLRERLSFLRLSNLPFGTVAPDPNPEENSDATE